MKNLIILIGLLSFSISTNAQITTKSLGTVPLAFEQNVMTFIDGKQCDHKLNIDRTDSSIPELESNEPRKSKKWCLGSKVKGGMRTVTNISKLAVGAPFLIIYGGYLISKKMNDT